MRQERGDTLVEVLIAISILGAAVVTGLGIMSYGFGLILNSIERTQVQAAVNSQLSLIQYARDTFIRANKIASPGGAQVWVDMVAGATATYSTSTCDANSTPQTGAANNPFYVDEQAATRVSFNPAAPATNGPATAGKGLWVEAVQPTGSNYIDFYVKACWQPVVGSTGQESRSVMRLYAP